MGHSAAKTLTHQQLELAAALVEPGIAFCEAEGFPVGAALIRHRWQQGSASDVLDALARYQNEDGGFGRNLEVDIKSDASNAFAARLAMQVLLALDSPSESEIVSRLQSWLTANQHEDGDWHFSQAIYDAPLPPWFAGWSFPALNPACCVAGLASRLGIASETMLSRIEHLFAAKSSHADARNGAFYDALPYVEYVPFADVSERDVWLDELAANISGATYDDATHFMDHALGGGADLAARIPDEIFSRQVDALIGEAGADGGWPSPYDQGWRPHVTMSALTVLAGLRG